MGGDSGIRGRQWGKCGWGQWVNLNDFPIFPLNPILMGQWVNPKFSTLSHGGGVESSPYPLCPTRVGVGVGGRGKTQSWKILGVKLHPCGRNLGDWIFHWEKSLYSSDLLQLAPHLFKKLALKHLSLTCLWGRVDDNGSSLQNLRKSLHSPRLLGIMIYGSYSTLYGWC